jgi:hypothetical protein
LQDFLEVGDDSTRLDSTRLFKALLLIGKWRGDSDALYFWAVAAIYSDHARIWFVIWFVVWFVVWWLVK